MIPNLWSSFLLLIRCVHACFKSCHWTFFHKTFSYRYLQICQLFMGKEQTFYYPGIKGTKDFGKVYTHYIMYIGKYLPLHVPLYGYAT